LDAIVPDFTLIIHDRWIAIEEAMSVAEDQDASQDEDKGGDAESAAECGNPRLLYGGDDWDYLMSDQSFHC